MSVLTDIQAEIENLRSLQESYHDLCTLLSALDLTSVA